MKSPDNVPGRAGLRRLAQFKRSLIERDDAGAVGEPDATTGPASSPVRVAPEQVLHLYEELGITKLLAAVGTETWRLRRRMVEPGSEAPRPEMKRSFRHVEAMTQHLLDFGVEVRDHTGERLPENGVSAVQKIAFEPREGIDGNYVIETVKPSIFFEGAMIQMGDVIVGVPATRAHTATDERDELAGSLTKENHHHD